MLWSMVDYGLFESSVTVSGQALVAHPNLLLAAQVLKIQFDSLECWKKNMTQKKSKMNKTFGTHLLSLPGLMTWL